MVADLEQTRDLYHRSVGAFIQGDPEEQMRLWSRRDDVTLANPLGPPAKGFEDVRRVVDVASTQISDGEGYTFESISVVETPDLAYEVGIEHSWASLGSSPQKVPVSLRVTTVFRREDGDWKIVHRHADPITEERSIETVRSRT